jgi:hypothetical protein
MHGSVLLVSIVFLCLSGTIAVSQTAIPNSGLASADEDHDGLPGSFEQELLSRFAPHFMVSKTCATLPAEFFRRFPDPITVATNGTIYGKVFKQQIRGGSVNGPDANTHHPLQEVAATSNFATLAMLNPNCPARFRSTVTCTVG